MKIMVDSEYLDKLKKSAGFKDDGSLEVGKNLEVDGGASFLGQALKILDAQDINSDVIGHFMGYVDEENKEAAGIIVDPNDAGINYSFTNLPFLSLKENSLITFDVTLNTLKESSAITNSSLFVITLKDNLKTLFGNQSLVGRGNIDLYRHELSVQGANGANASWVYYTSSSNLKCDSVQDLRTLLKVGDIPVWAPGNLATGTFAPIYLYVSSSSCVIKTSETESTPVIIVSDKVTTI